METPMTGPTPSVKKQPSTNPSISLTHPNRVSRDTRIGHPLDFGEYKYSRGISSLIPSERLSHESIALFFLFGDLETYFDCTT